MLFSQKSPQQFLAISWTELEESEDGSTTPVKCPRTLLVSPVVRYSEELNAIGLIDDVQVDIALDIQSGIETDFEFKIPKGIDVESLTVQAWAMINGATSKRYTVSGITTSFEMDENEEVQPINGEIL